MPGTTPLYGFRYQLPGDPPDGASLGLNLATDVENTIASNLGGIMCELVQQTAQTGWATGAAVPLTFLGGGSEVVDTGAFHEIAGPVSRITIGKKLGWWEVSGVYVPLNSTNSQSVRAYLQKNGTPIPGTFAGFLYGASTTIVAVTVPRFLVQATVATDYVEIVGQQNLSTGTGGTVVSAPASSSFTAVWKSPN